METQEKTGELTLTVEEAPQESGPAPAKGKGRKRKGETGAEGGTKGRKRGNRANGEGTYARAPRGGVKYVVRMTIGGKLKTFSTTAETRTAAREEWEATKEARIAEANGVVPVRTDDEDALREYLPKWLRRGTDWAEKTRESYTYHVHRSLIPELGDYRLKDISRVVLQDWMTRRENRGRPPTENERLYEILRAALKAAHDLEIITTTPWAKVRFVRPTEKVIKVWTPFQARRFLAAAETHRLGPLWRLATIYGLRSGELKGLLRRDLDVTGRLLTIQQAYAELSSGKRVLSTPKTEAGKRVIALSPEMVRALVAHMERMDREIEQHKHSNRELMFPSMNGTPLFQRALNDALASLCARANVPELHMHALRHTAVTNALRAGVEVITVSKVAGHTDPGFTMKRYGAYTHDAGYRAAEKAEGILTNAVRVQLAVAS